MVKRKSGAGDEHCRVEPEDHDYPAATAYLSLIHAPAEVKRVVGALQKAPLERRQAKGLLRASSYHLDENADIPCQLADLVAE
jgi:hypothetical protein